MGSFEPVPFESPLAALSYAETHGGVPIGRGSEFAVVPPDAVQGYPGWMVLSGSLQFSASEDFDVVQFAAGQMRLFDESKVKRDDDGKFAEKPGGGKKVTVPPRDEADAEDETGIDHSGDTVSLKVQLDKSVQRAMSGEGAIFTHKTSEGRWVESHTRPDVAEYYETNGYDGEILKCGPSRGEWSLFRPAKAKPKKDFRHVGGTGPLKRVGKLD